MDRKIREEFVEFSKNITGFAPYEYQIKVLEHLLNGKNVILSVPTGAGKTWASILPFLFFKSLNSKDFPPKMIYSLPLRALCNSIYEDVKKALEKTGYTEDEIKRQTGEFSDDKYFEKEMVFSTIDQTLSNFLCFPLPLSQRQANINAGALIGSYLVFDEFHLLEETRSMATTLGMLRMLNNLSRFCIMTATLTDEFINNVKAVLPNVEIVTLNGFKADKEKIGSLQVPENRECKKEIEVTSGIIKADKIKEFHDDKTIVICNRVETAQRVYLELEDWAKEKGIKLICLHSRFFDRHRKATEKQLKKLFGKDVKDKKTNSILISTQVIEAGMDISCKVMHTEIAPINALLQRVGRCARYEGEYGKIFVYDVLKEEQRAKLEAHSLINEDDFKELSKCDKAEIRKIKNIYLPYSQQLSEATLEKLRLPQNQQLSEAVTIRLVNEILGEAENSIFNTIKVGGYNIKEISNSWNSCQKSNYRTLVRDIQSSNAVIVSNQSFAEKHPYSLEDIGMYKWSLIKWVKEILETVDTEEDWVVGILEDNSFVGEDADESERNLKFRAIKNIDEVIAYYDTLYLNNKYFCYDEKIGFNRERGNMRSNFKEQKNKEKEVFGAYRKDTFMQHTNALLGVFSKDFLPKLDYSFSQFNRFLNTNVDFKQLIQLILILHDYGKLNHTWQLWMQTYQHELSKMTDSPYTFDKGIPLGHTGFDSIEEKELFTIELETQTKKIEKAIKKKLGTRPPHAGVGAKVIEDLLYEYFENNKESFDVVIPASMAIARHHGVTNSNFPTFDISDYHYDYINELLKEFKMPNIKLQQREKNEGGLEVLELGQQEHFLLYLFFVRILRLCDQKATEDFEKYLQ
ncbi:MAG: CRISPR-associated endonuclease/helicase Cas3 [Vicingaceae bacterium]|jgi:CRISPR-associated endonuclease/helicase Cas3